MIDIKSHFSIEKIENGYIVRDENAARAVHVTYDFAIARQIELFMHEAVTDRLATQAALEAEPQPDTLDIQMQQDEA